MSERINCKECGSWLSPSNAPVRALEDEFRAAFGYADTRPEKPYGVNGLIVTLNVVDNVRIGATTPAQVIECAMSQLPRDAKLYPFDFTGTGLIHQLGPGYGRPLLYILFTSHEWEPTPPGGAFGKHEINWGDLDK